jgi:hypothetical protein
MNATELRRQRVRQLIKEGRVMNDSLRRRNKIQKTHEQKVEQMADVILRQMATNSTPIRNVTTTKQPIPEANVFLKQNQKTDKLAIKATKILQELSF